MLLFEKWMEQLQHVIAVILFATDDTQEYQVLFIFNSTEKLLAIIQVAQYLALNENAEETLTCLPLVADGCTEHCALCTTAGAEKCNDDQCNVGYTNNYKTNTCDGT